MTKTAPLPFSEPIFVTRPIMPGLSEYRDALQGVWQRHWLTNKGAVHDELELALCKHLRLSNLSLVANCTAGLMLAFKAFELGGEVITTPFTSPATINALTWIGLQPVFADIDPVKLNLDPSAAEKAVTSSTSAILGVHLYGMPCDIKGFEDVGRRHRVKIIYDCAHAFGAEIDGLPLAAFGDAGVLSFHATKLFNTGEGGAITAADPEIKRKVDLLKTLGIQDENTVALPGINARMNELEAALGLENLKLVEQEREARARIAEIYRQRLANVPGFIFQQMPPHVRDSHHYFMVRINAESSAATRDDIYNRLKSFNVFTRRYFYPLCSNLSFYKSFPSSNQKNLPHANRAADEVLCLPFYGSLDSEGAHRICDMLIYSMNGEA